MVFCALNLRSFHSPKGSTLENLIRVQLVYKYLLFYGIQKFITDFHKKTPVVPIMSLDVA